MERAGRGLGLGGGGAEVLKMVSSGKSVMERKFLSGRTGGSVVVR